MSPECTLGAGPGCAAPCSIGTAGGAGNVARRAGSKSITLSRTLAVIPSTWGTCKFYASVATFLRRRRRISARFRKNNAIGKHL